jgi:hypothetical protein
MIEPVGAVGRIDAAALVAAPGASVRQTLDRRQKRLRWLGSLREALGETGPLIDEMAADDNDEALLAETRERIAAALDTIEEMRGFRSGDALCEQDAPTGTGATVTAAEIAHRIGISRDATLRVQARLGVAAVRQLVGEDSAADAVNGA